MLEFTELQQSAESLSKRLSRNYGSNFGCVGFFSVLIPNNTALSDSFTIALTARSLSEENDEKLLAYVKSFSRYSVVSTDEFNEFKRNVLSGMYLLMWSHYNSTVSHYMHHSLVQLFQKDLGVNSPEEMDVDWFNSSLTAVSQYCSYLYMYKDDLRVYSELNQRLGEAVQADIETVRNSRVTTNSSWYDLYNGFMCTLGINNRS
ncbi:hypothetical protein [Legionella shakespearei]|uniref:Uncharacterized protein n=1 Tax=Legionella shakespearei DSM 23087 TaxID=1122169 RepID=A0A0W0YQ90_9GAMM|nr:hypothetical protein [Legionella shakespearei]KTD59033.1 hypothetical protein Lsha_2065 [Legionella shakespearei DSM 23087]